MLPPDDGVADLEATSGDQPAGCPADELLGTVYRELRALAASFLQSERRDHTLQPTALVHEAWLRLTNDPEREWNDRTHFVACAAKAMRRVLVYHAVGRRRLKRGGGASRVPLDAITVLFEDSALDLLALEEALERLGARDDRALRIVELRFFGGLDIVTTAKVLGVSHATVERDWKFARAWLHREVSGAAEA